MRNILFLFFCLFPFLVTGQAIIIDNPDYCFKTSGLETISRVELHDTVTKVHVHVTFIPHWWMEYDAMGFIQPVGSGERYHLVDVENAEMNTHLRTPSGIADYVLLFPPLDKSVKEIHYGTLRDYEEEITIFNVSLEKSFDAARYEKSREIPAPVAKRLEEEVLKTAGKETADFDADNFFNDTPSRLVGFIRGYVSDSLQTPMIYSQRLNGEFRGVPLTIYPDGYFEADIHTEHPKMLSFRILSEGEISFYIEPGHTLSMILDWEDVLDANRYRDRRYILPKTVFGGELAEVNRELLRRTIFKPNGHDVTHRMNNMDPDDHKRDLENRIKENLEALQKTQAEHALSPKARRLIENEIKMDALSELLRFSMHHLQRENNNTGKPLLVDYYSPLQILPSNDRSVLSALSADRMLSQLGAAGIFFRPGNLYRPEFNPEQSFTDYLLGEEVVLSDETLSLLPLMERIFDAGAGDDEELKKEIMEHREAIERVFQQHLNELMAYQKMYMKHDPWEEYKAIVQKRDEILTDSLHVSGILKDVQMFRFYNDWLRGNPHIPVDELKRTTGNFSDRLSEPYLKKCLAEMSILSTGSPYIDFTEKTISGEPFKLSSLVPRKKLVLLDFWASWCGPCIQEIPQLQELYGEYKDKGLEIVGVSLDDQESNWQKTVVANDLPWIQVICNNKNPENAANRYNVRSIPSTVLIDNTGKIIAFNLRGKELIEKIDELLK